MHVFGRILAFLLLLGILVAGGVAVYNAGVSAGVAADVANAIASGDAVPIPYYPGPYLAHPWGYGGFGFFGILFGIFFLFLIFGLLRAVVGGGHRGRWHHDDDGSKRDGWQSHLNEWHDAQHATPPNPPTA